MKEFEVPELEVVFFAAEDIITTSGAGDAEWGGEGEGED